MKEEITKLIDKLASPSHTQGSDICIHYDCPTEGLIMIGDVLERATAGIVVKQVPYEGLYPGRLEELLELWQPCGFSKSLQQIFDCEWEHTGEWDCAADGHTDATTKLRKVLAPKDPNIKALGELLLTLFNN